MCVCVCVQFFQKRGVAEAMSVYELFNCVTGLNLIINEEDEAEFLAQVKHCGVGAHPFSSPCWWPLLLGVVRLRT